MRQLLPILLATAPRDPGGRFTPFEEARPMRRVGTLLTGLALLVVGCASQSLMPKEQALAIRTRDRALSSHSNAIHEAIRQSGNLGGLAFLDATDGHLVVLPGDSPGDAWARYTTSPPASSPTGRVSVPAVVSFVYRADVPKAPETVTAIALQEQLEVRQAAEVRAQALRTSLAALENELRDEQRRTEERLGTVTAQITHVQRDLSDLIATTRQETQQSIGTAREDMQKAVKSLAEELAAARKFMLQTAQLGWLNHELNVENANGIRRVATASQELTSNSARLADAMRQLSDSLASQLKELTERLDGIQSSLNKIK
jgi:hypothetical protein